MRKASFLILGTVTLLFLTGVTFPQVFDAQAAATNYSNVNLLEFYGSSSTSWTIHNTLFETDPDVKSLLTGNQLSLWGTDVSLEGLTLDYTEWSYGRHTTDWTGEVGSSTNVAYGGNYYWCPNVSSSPITTSSGNAQVISDPTVATPASGGYKLTATITFDDETTENSDIDASGRNFLFGSVGDFSGVDIELNSNSYVLINAAFTLSVLNTTAIPRVGIYFIIHTAGGADVAVCYSLASGVTSDTVWEDGSTSSLESSIFKTTDEDVIRWEVNATSTSEVEYVRYWKVDDLLSKSAAYTSDTPASIQEWGYYAASKYSSGSSGGTVGTVKVKNLLFVKNIEDLALFEKTDKSDSAAQESNNFPNATSQAVTPSDEYVLEDGFDFAISSSVSMNRLTFSAYTVVYTPTVTYDVYDRTNLIALKKAVFDSSPPTAVGERVTSPSTFYLNASSLSANYQLVNAYVTKVEDENSFWDSDGDLKSAYTCVDKDSSPTLNELSDIYKDMSVIDSPIRFGATAFNSVSDAFMFYLLYYVTSADIVAIDLSGGSSTGGAGLSLPGILLKVQQNFPDVVFRGILAGIFAGICLFVLGWIPRMKADNKAAEKIPTWIKIGAAILFLFFFVLFLAPILG